MERACEEANTQESPRGGARPLGGLSSERRQKGGGAAKMVARAAWSKAARRELPPGATLAGHDPDAARKDERVGGLNPRRLRTTRDRSRISRSPAVGALWLLWHHRQRQGTPQLPAPC